MKKRINFIDIARALAIIFIVLGHTIVHSNNCGTIFKFLYSFHVVMFFIISGYTFQPNENEKLDSFIKNKFMRLMIPYFIWALLFLIPYMIMGEEVSNSVGTNSSFNLKTQIINILYGNGNASALKQNSSLWFLPALFSIEIIYYFFIKIINKNSKIKMIILIPILLIAYITESLLSIPLPWGINTALSVGIFFYIGYLFNSYKVFKKEKLFKIKFMVPIFIIGLTAFYFNDTVSCIDYDYGNFTLSLISGLCISTFMIYLTYIINKNKWLEYIGKNTLGILIFHKLIVIVFQTKLGEISALLRNSNFFVEMILGILVSSISITFSLVTAHIIKKIFPILLGDKKHTNQS